MVEIAENFLLGRFNKVIEKVNQKTLDHPLVRLCYFESLLDLNKFDEFYENIQAVLDSEEKEILDFYFQLFTLNFVPRCFYSKFDKTKDYYKHFQELYNNFDNFLNKKPQNPQLDPYYWYYLLNIYELMLNFLSKLFELQKSSFGKYTSLKIRVLNNVKEIESKLLTVSLSDNDEIAITWKALIYYQIGRVYSALEDSFEEQKNYEQSLSLKFNIFALDSFINFLDDKEKKEKAKDLFDSFKKSIKDIEETEYSSYFNVIGLLLEDENKEKAREYYYKAISIIENNEKPYIENKKKPYKLDTDSYPYYNLALFESSEGDSQKDYPSAQKNLESAIEIIQEASDVYLKKEETLENFIYFFEDFRDFLYEKCRVEIIQNKKKDYETTLELISRLKEITYRLGYNKLGAKLVYDFALLKDRIYEKENKKAVESLENCLENVGHYLSKEEKAEVRARLAKNYLRLSKIDKYNKNIRKALELDPKCDTALKLISQREEAIVNLLDSKQVKRMLLIECVFIGATIIVAFLIYLSAYLSAKFSFVPKYGEIAIDISLLFLLGSFYFIILYPMIHSIKIYNVPLNSNRIFEILFLSKILLMI